MEENFDIKGGFRIKSEESDTYQYQLNSITQSLGYAAYCLFPLVYL